VNTIPTSESEAPGRPPAVANDGELELDPHVTPYQRAQWCASLLDRNLAELEHQPELRAWFESSERGNGTFLHCASVCGYNADELRNALRQRGLLDKEQS